MLTFGLKNTNYAYTDITCQGPGAEH